MEDTNIFELVFLAIIAGVLIYRLNSVLGTRPDNDVKPSAPDMPAKEPETLQAAVDQQPVYEPEEEFIKQAEQKIQADTPLSEKFLEFKMHFPEFEVASFLHGAKAAFELITSSFAKGDLNAMQGLVSDNVYNSYKTIIDDRKNEGQTLEFEVIRFIDAEVKDASIEDGHKAKIQVGFTTEQVNVLKDKEGKVLSGSDSFINKVHDLWSFVRDINSSNPNWTLVAAKSG